MTLASVIVAGLLGAQQARAQFPSAGSGESFRINGYSSLEFERMFQAEGRGDANGSFDADLFDIVLNWQAHDDLRIAADLTWEHGSASEDGRGNVAVEYAWVEYALSDAVRFRGGKMFTPFGIYNEIHTAKPAFLTVKEPLSTNKSDKFGSDVRFYPRWGTGVGILGNGTSPVGDWDYVLAVTNGEQEQTNPFEEDDNKPKAVAARVRLAVAGQLELGASAYLDRLTELDPVTEEPTAGRTQQVSFGAQVAWRLPAPARGAGLELEWVSGAFRPSSGSGRRDVWAHGATAMLFWTLAEKYTPYARVEYLDPDSVVAHDHAVLYIAGLNVRLASRLVLKAEVDTVRAGVANSRFAGGLGKYSEIKAAAVVGF